MCAATRYNIQKLCSTLTVYLCVMCCSQNKQRLFPYKLIGFYNRGACLLRGTNSVNITHINFILQRHNPYRSKVELNSTALSAVPSLMSSTNWHVT